MGMKLSLYPRNPPLTDIPTRRVESTSGSGCSVGSWRNTISWTWIDGTSRASRSHLLCGSLTRMRSHGTKSFLSFILLDISVSSSPIPQNSIVVWNMRAILTRRDHCQRSQPNERSGSLSNSIPPPPMMSTSDLAMSPIL